MELLENLKRYHFPKFPKIYLLFWSIEFTYVETNFIESLIQLYNFTLGKQV
jgi:hypothetical protein